MIKIRTCYWQRPKFFSTAWLMLMFPPEPIEEVTSEQKTEQATQERSETGTGLSTPVQVDTNQSQQKIDTSAEAPRVQ